MMHAGRFTFFREDSGEWGNRELESFLPWDAFLIMIVGLNALFTEHFVWLELMLSAWEIQWLVSFFLS